MRTRTSQKRQTNKINKQNTNGKMLKGMECRLQQ